jgi:single-stranded DNA-binding protein
MANTGYVFATACGTVNREPREITTGRNKMAACSVVIERESSDGRSFKQYLDVVGYGFMAERILDNFREGDTVVAHGELSQKKYQKKDGSDGYSLQLNVSNGCIESGAGKRQNRDDRKVPLREDNEDRDDRRESRRDDRDDRNDDRDRARDDRYHDRDRPPARDSRYEKDDDDPFDN